MPTLVLQSADPTGMALRLLFQYGVRAPTVAAARLAEARAQGRGEDIALWVAVERAMLTATEEDERGRMLARWRDILREKEQAPKVTAVADQAPPAGPPASGLSANGRGAVKDTLEIP
jgi:hypothetical protein